MSSPAWTIGIFACVACLESGQTDDLYARAELARKEKREDEALALYRELLLKAPDHIEGHLGYQKLLQSQGKEQELVKEYEGLAERRAEPWTLYLLGRLLHEPAREEVLYRRGLEKSPEDHRLRLALASALRRQLRWDDAAKEYREAIRLEPDSIDVHTSFLYLLENSGRTEEMLALYRATAAKGPKDWRAQLLYGKALAIAGDWESSWKFLERARELAPNETAVLATIATYHFKRNRTDSAQEILENLLRDDPHDAALLWRTGMLRLIVRQDARGLRLVEEASRLEPGDSEIFAQLGTSRMIAKDFLGAERAITEAIRLDASNAYAVASMGTLRMAQRQYAQAIDYFEAAARLKSRAAEYRISLAEACEKHGMTERARIEREAAEKLKRQEDFRVNLSVGGAAVLHSSLAEANDLVALAKSLVIEGRFDEAASKFEESIRVAPDLVAAYWHWARVERRRKRLQPALEVYSRLLAVCENRGVGAEVAPDVLSAMAECHYDLGDRREALDLWRSARDKLPEGAVRRERFDEMLGRLERPDPRSQVFRIEGLPIADCTEPNWCAPRSIAAVLSHWKIPSDLNTLACELGVGDGGTTVRSLMDALQQRTDVRAACFSFRSALVKDFLKRGYPVIRAGFVLHDGDYNGHVSVVAGFDDERGVFLLEDSNWFSGVDRLRFAEAEGDRAILIAPPAEFAAVADSLPDRPFWDLVNFGESVLNENPAEALAFLEQAVKLRSDDFLSHLYLGFARESLNHLEAAQAAYQRADGLPQADARVNLRLAKVLHRMGNPGEAEEILQVGLKREPRYGTVLAKLVEIAWNENHDVVRALSYCERLLVAVPATGHVLYAKGVLLAALERRADAIDAFSWAALRGGPPSSYLYLGQLLRAAGERQRAIEALEKYSSLAQDEVETAGARQIVDELRKEEDEKKP
jgi:tetratricopeptide (TPR) repeat protein